VQAGVIRALAKSLSDWFRRENRQNAKKFELAARGPHGSVDFESDGPPDVDSLADSTRAPTAGAAQVRGRP
jgi:hypothetical protein